MSKKLRNHDEVVFEQMLNPEMASAYLDVAIEEYEQDGDIAFFLEALRNVVEAREGMTRLAEKTGLNRQNLYRVLSPEGNPELRTISLILHNLGYRLSVQPIQASLGHDDP
ncbi:addiction module antidote protein [Nostoc sp. 'Peltigera membranacea cyanobiont' 232]|jgi:probable addiction module antidote protein|uniref:addiction module antidote protein n=1 Tax=Nostoc sp. 'Peltigera membranacea cyanobiont' 232 TaxID=2014531 RepID=UPI000B958C8B|nr:addiction module antidote protein [Nostoc sp. 'Peltigera membranacea cyanobiont' 232]OYE00962.1 putative addiction module antidote protein [Nostoc sp. 'Peltigera membranacea cyanobiont' 232]